MELKRVVVTGMGAITPLGMSVTEYWDGLANGVSGADFIKQFDTSKFKTKFACEVKNFEPTNYLDRKESRKIDRFAQFALIASDQAVKDAGINEENVNHDRVGVIFASGIGGLITFQEEVTNFEVKIRIDDHDVSLRPGLSCTAEIETDLVKDVVAVPMQSVTIRTGESNLSPEEIEKRKQKAAARDKGDSSAEVTSERQEKQIKKELGLQNPYEEEPQPEATTSPSPN